MEVYLSEASFKTPLRFGQLNTIIAPCGSGKTTFISKKLPRLFPTEKCIVCLTPFIAAKNQLLSLGFFKADTEELFGMETFLSTHKQIIATYQQFAWMIKNFPEIWNYIGILILDEVDYIHKILSMEMGDLSKRWGKKVNYETCRLEQNQEILMNNKPMIILPSLIETAAKNYSFLSVAISATGLNKIKELFPSTEVIETHETLINYRFETENFKKLETALNWILSQKSKEEKVLIYTKRIKTQLEIQEYLKLKNIISATLFSRNNQNFEMKEIDFKILKEIENEEPSISVEVVIINESMERAINILDRKFQYVLINDSNETSQIQATGRLRFNFKQRFLLGKEDSFKKEVLEEDILKEYLNKELFEEEKTKLCERLKWKGNNRTILKWRGVKTKLELEYNVIDKRKMVDGQNKRYSIITERK